MESTLILKRKSYLKKNWYLPLIVAAIFLLISIPAYAVITGFNFTQVGSAIYSIFAVGATTFSVYSVGGYSTNATSNTMAQNLIPVIAVVVITLWGLKALAQTEGVDGFIKTCMVFVIGAILLGAIVVILSQLT